MATNTLILYFFNINSTQGALRKIISLKAYVIFGDAVWRVKDQQ